VNLMSAYSDVNWGAELGIDLRELREESFAHLAHYRMLLEHSKRVKAWENYQEQQSRHTERNSSVQLDRDKITTNRKNGH